MSVTFEYTLPVLRSRPMRRIPHDLKRAPGKRRAEPLPNLLALGHLIQDRFERGELTSFYEAARRLKRTESRISQIVSLCTLAPDIQERVLLGQLTIAEIHIRKALASADWEQQRAILEKLWGVTESLPLCRSPLRGRAAVSQRPAVGQGDGDESETGDPRSLRR